MENNDMKKIIILSYIYRFFEVRINNAIFMYTNEKNTEF